MTLERFSAVSRDEKPALRSLAARVAVDFADRAWPKDLWEAHQAAVPRLKEVVDEDPSLEEVGAMPVPEQSLLDLKVALARKVLENCVLCVHRCGIDRSRGRTGVCGVSDEALISSEFLHLGEEPELVPSHTVFFGGCTLQCVFCQNHEIANMETTFTTLAPEELAARVDRKRRNDSRNVNWVGGNPTPNVPYILQVLRAVETNVPSVWNSNMYMTREAMEILRGTQDLFLADLKYGNDHCGFALSGVQGYYDTVRRNLLLAREQSELLIRHLVLPGHLECCTEPALNWVAQDLGPGTRVNVMFQYRPEHRARDRDDIDRPLTAEEKRRAREMAEDAGLTNLI